MKKADYIDENDLKSNTLFPPPVPSRPSTAAANSTRPSTDREGKAPPVPSRPSSQLYSLGIDFGANGLVNEEAARIVSSFKNRKPSTHKLRTELLRVSKYSGGNHIPGTYSDGDDDSSSVAFKVCIFLTPSGSFF